MVRAQLRPVTEKIPIPLTFFLTKYFIFYTVLLIKTNVQIMKNSYSPARTVQKAFKILEVIGEKQFVKPSELVKQLQLSRSNVHRLLSTLIELGYAEKSNDGKFRLGLKIFILGNLIPLRNQLADIAHPYLVKLAAISQENINLAIMYEKKVLYIDKIESSHYLKLDQAIGRTDPLHCTALGKIFLSGMSDQELETFLQYNKLVRYTKNTIIVPITLTKVIKNIKKQGYAVDLEELSEGINCIASPIYNHKGQVIAAISISAPSMRLEGKKVEKLKHPLIETVAEISKKIGFTF
jgi:DNA-binding IclR family transcriptional regulator